jgi:predicted ATPase
VPPGIQHVISARLAQLSPHARELAGLAAAIGRDFTFQLLAQASRMDEDTVIKGLDELWRRRIVRERENDSYYLAHNRYREVAYAQLSAGHRQAFHRRIAEALAVIYEGMVSAEDVYGQIALHYEQAGLPKLAASFNGLVADPGRRALSSDEAVDRLRRVLALLGTAPPGLDVQIDPSWPTGVLHESIKGLVSLVSQVVDGHRAYRRSDQAPGPDQSR